MKDGNDALFYSPKKLQLACFTRFVSGSTLRIFRVRSGLWVDIRRHPSMFSKLTGTAGGCLRPTSMMQLRDDHHKMQEQQQQQQQQTTTNNQQPTTNNQQPPTTTYNRKIQVMDQWNVFKHQKLPPQMKVLGGLYYSKLCRKMRLND